MNFLGAGICPTSFQSCEGFQNAIPFMSKTLPSPLFKTKYLVWMFKICHGGQNKVNIQFAYVSYVRVSEFLEGERGDTNTLVKWNVYKNFQSQMDVKQSNIKNHFKHTW